VATLGPHAPYTRTPSSHTPMKPRGSALIPFVTPRPLPDRWNLLLAALLDHRPSSQTNTSLLCALCPHSCTLEKTSRSVTHPKIALGQAHLTSRFFRDRFPKKMHLISMSTLLILLSIGPRYHHPLGQDIRTRPKLGDWLGGPRHLCY
jgi:hypothetical protein